MIIEILTYQGLNLNNGIGTQVNPTVSNKNDFLPQTSDKAPMSGALKNDKNPYKIHYLMIIKVIIEYM